MIINTSVSSPVTPTISSTSNAPEQTAIAPIQVTNTSRKMTTGTHHEQGKITTSEVAGYSAFGLGLGVALTAALGVGVPGVIATGIAYSACCGAAAKVGDNHRIEREAKKVKEKQD